MTPSIATESPESAEAAALIGELNAELLALYHPDECHHLTVAQLAQPNTFFCVARDAGVAVGCGALRRMDGYAEVKRMYVRPSFRGQGIARVILLYLEDEGARQSVGILRLETGEQSHAAIRLYEGAGYVRIPAFGEYTENGVSVCYEKHLT